MLLTKVLTANYFAAILLMYRCAVYWATDKHASCYNWGKDKDRKLKLLPCSTFDSQAYEFRREQVRRPKQIEIASSR